MTFQEWYTSISIEGDMKHNMGRAWDAALASLQSPAQDPSVWVDRAMTLAQEFASSWSLVGGRFDSGDGLAIAEAAKAELRAFLESTPLPQAAQPICDDCLQRKVCTKEGCRKPVSEQNARFAIDGAITYGRQGINKPPTDDHWLMPFWQIGRQLAAQPKQAAPKILTIGQRVAAVRALQDYVEQALDEYELCGDEGYYTPNKDESLLIHDCVQGLLADQDFIRLVAALALPYVEPTAAPASPSLTECEAVDAQKVRNDALAGFDVGELADVAEGLENGYEKTVNVGNVTGEGDAHLETTTAYAARFIRAYLEAALQSQPASAGKDAEDARRWISITDRLPEPNQVVCLVDENRWRNTGGDFDVNVHACGYLASVGHQMYWSCFSEPRGLTLDAFTHWTPVPAISAIAQKENGK